MLEAVIDALEHELGDFFIEAQRLGHVEADARMFGGGLGNHARDVGGGVAAGSEEVRMYDDEGGALFDALVESVFDGGLGEFHVRRFDDFSFRDALEECSDVEEEVVGGGFLAAVVDDDEADGVAGIGEHRSPVEGMGESKSDKVDGDGGIIAREKAGFSFLSRRFGPACHCRRRTRP